MQKTARRNEKSEALSFWMEKYELSVTMSTTMANKEWSLYGMQMLCRS